MSDDRGEFWRFSLKLYGREGVAPLCLALQDEAGVDVNVLFYLLYRASGGAGFSPAELAQVEAAIAPWRAEVVQPLRAARRAMKTDALWSFAGDEGRLREEVKRVELQAERLQQMALERIGAGIPGTATAPREALRQSWDSYGRHLGAALPAEAEARFATALGL